METPKRLIAGAMSGTSGDGVDVAIVRIDGKGLGMSVLDVTHGHLPFKPDVRSLLFAVRDAQHVRLGDVAQLCREITLAYAHTLKKFGAEGVEAVAAHGQTIYHDPPNTIQLFDPSLLAAEMGCPVISDFRRADCAAGGQGAPLVPFADYILFRDPKKSRVLLNIGGIANITFMPAGATIDQLIAFDTGPGNCVSDWICRTNGPSGLGWDADGAAQGRVLQSVVDSFLKHRYFAAPPPKSTDGPEMIDAFNQALKAETGAVAMNDLLATAAKMTAVTIHRAIESLPSRPDEVIASGGGIYNKTIMQWLKSACEPAMAVKMLDEVNVKSDAKEAIAFALLAAATLDGVPSNVPSVTGAHRAVVPGSITPKP